MCHRWLKFIIRSRKQQDQVIEKSEKRRKDMTTEKISRTFWWALFIYPFIAVLLSWISQVQATVLCTPLADGSTIISDVSTTPSGNIVTAQATGISPTGSYSNVYVYDSSDYYGTLGHY